MTELIAIGYSDTVTARIAMEEVEQLSRDFVIRGDEMAAISLDDSRTFKTFINADIAGRKATWSVFWGMLFALLYFVPFLDLRIGTDFAEIMGKIKESGIDPEFQDRCRQVLTPGTSVLFLIVEYVTPDQVVEALDEFGGTVLQCKLTRRSIERVQEAIHGRRDVAV
jgi:uncharacterized membrane protein